MDLGSGRKTRELRNKNENDRLATIAAPPYPLVDRAAKRVSNTDGGKPGGNRASTKNGGDFPSPKEA